MADTTSLVLYDPRTADPEGASCAEPTRSSRQRTVLCGTRGYAEPTQPRSPSALVGGGGGG